MHRLQSIYLANNQISRVAADLGPNLPRLETLVLTNNRIAQLGDIDALASIQSLLLLSLLHNPVTRRPHYRAYVIHRFPRLRTLDFEKIKVRAQSRGAADPLAAAALRPDAPPLLSAAGRAHRGGEVLRVQGGQGAA